MHLALADAASRWHADLTKQRSGKMGRGRPTWRLRFRLWTPDSGGGEKESYQQWAPEIERRPCRAASAKDWCIAVASKPYNNRLQHTPTHTNEHDVC